MKLISLTRGDLDYTAIAASALHRLPAELKRMLQERGEWHDLLASVQLAACEAWRRNLDLKQTYNLAQRHIYSQLRALGWVREWRKGKVGNYIRREVNWRYVTSWRKYFSKEEER